MDRHTHAQTNVFRWTLLTVEAISNPTKVSYLMLIDGKSLLHGHLFMLTIGYAFSADRHKYSVDVRSSDMILPVVVSVAVVS